jgi:hypothetical protein
MDSLLVGLQHLPFLAYMEAEKRVRFFHIIFRRGLMLYSLIVDGGKGQLD